MDPVLKQLKQGIRRFQTEIFPQYAERYADAAHNPQRPHTLFITCADSRIDPNVITSSGPGELFVTRNIGNLVPVYGDATGGVDAVIEFAVSGLGVRHIVVCGHSECGAMKALLNPALVATLPAVTGWLEHAEAACPTGDAPSLSSLTEQNVLLQLEHLKTYPAVAEAITATGLTLTGWVYDIATGSIRIAENGEKTFHPIDID